MRLLLRAFMQAFVVMTVVLIACLVVYSLIINMTLTDDGKDFIAFVYTFLLAILTLILWMIELKNDDN